jgi:hypothetical protein
MTKKLTFLSITLSCFAPLIIGDTLSDTKDSNLVKSAIKTNGTIVHNSARKSVDDFHSMFEDGEFYGRLRNNNFYFAYDHDDSGHESQLVGALGASFVFNSASYSGFDFNIGLYGSQSFFDENKIDSVSHLKPAKDTLSRYEYVRTGSKSLFAFGQANLNYNYSKTNFTLGRQLVETFYTKSNDTKMIPNSFDGFVLASKDISQTKVTLAYLVKQKLRDHKDNHSVLMYDDRSKNSPDYSQWTGNDDSAMHRGLSYTNLKAAGVATDAPLIVLDAQNNSIKNLKINFSSYLVPQLLSQVMGEVNYKIPFDGFSITPALRYIQQFDNGAGRVGGASLKGTATIVDPQGYDNPNSLDAKMIAAKIVTRFSDYRLNLAYTQILDEADLVTPWRGFPTAGYTRSMGIYNWRANTKSYRLELVKGANKTGVYKKPFIQASVLYVDSDEDKAIFEDSMYYYIGLVQNIPSLANLQYRVRLGYRDFIGDDTKYSSYLNISNYLDSRLEFNYLF